MNNKGFEFSFGWIFSIIIGAVILFLAIYASRSLISSERTIQDTISGRELEILFNPLETQSFESIVKPRKLEFPSNTRLSMRCSATPPLGTHSTQVSSQSGVGDKWQNSGVANTVSGKYIFSESQLENDEFSLLVKPFNMPYKVSDMIIVWDEEYCFVNPPAKISDELNNLGLNESGLIISKTESLCPENSKTICFDSNNCDVQVDQVNKRISKKGTQVFYTEDLFFPALLSDSQIYECEVKRLLLRTSSLAELYKTKSQFLGIQESGCSSVLQAGLNQLGSVSLIKSNATSLDLYSALNQVQIISEELDNMNRQASCKLWGVA